MKKLICVLYRELTPDPDEQQGLPSIREAISESPQEHEEKIVAYLRGSIILGGRGSYEHDIFDPAARMPISAHPCTDGTYFWTLDLAYYVKKYHVRLPREFIRHMASRNWRPPKKEEIDVDSLEF